MNGAVIHAVPSHLPEPFSNRNTTGALAFHWDPVEGLDEVRFV